jgi:tetratricopeptide (TPR) repeat protein
MKRILISILVLVAIACSSAPKKPPRRDPGSLKAQRQRAANFMSRGDYAAAAGALDSLTRAFPSDSDLFELLGDAERGAKHVDPAIKSYEQAIRLNYGAYAPHMKLGTLLMENGKTGRALTEFELAVKASDRDVLARYNYGVALHETGRNDEALAQWRIAADIAPNDVRVAEALAMGLAQANDSTAVAQFELARELGADDASFHNNYALVLDRMGRNDEAEVEFRAAQEKAPAGKENEYRRNYAVHLLRAGRNQEAASSFDALVKSAGGLWSDTVYLARARLELKQYDGAITVLEPFALDVESGKIARSSSRIDRMPPTLDEALDVLGMCWRGKGDHKKAIDYLKRAVALSPRDVSHLNNYGVVLADGGMLPDARAQWKRVLDIDPQNATAKANLSAFGR